MMKSFSYNIDRTLFAARLLKCITDNVAYFRYFNHEDTEEAIQKAFEHGLKSSNMSYEDLTPYVKKLARTILRVKTRFIPYSLYNDDGEVSLVFSRLLEEQDPLEFEHKERVLDSLGELYLHNKEEFMKLESLLICTNPLDVKERIKDEFLRTELLRLCTRFDGRIVFYCISDFFKELKASQTPVVEEIRKIKLKPADYTLASKITQQKWVLTKNGEPIGIDVDTLDMDGGYNLDLAPFRLAKGTGCSVIRIDISEYLSTIEEYVFVNQGVDTPYIEWCRNKFKLITPAGTELIAYDRSKYMDLVKQELILNMLGNSINTIIAISPDYVYVKPTRLTEYSSIMVTTAQGRNFTLPVETIVTASSKHSSRALVSAV